MAARAGGPNREKPTKGMCSSCQSYDMKFYDDGRGECLECGHRFWWDKGPKDKVRVGSDGRPRDRDDDRPSGRRRESDRYDPRPPGRRRDRGDRDRDDDFDEDRDLDEDETRFGPGGKHWGVGDPHAYGDSPDGPAGGRGRPGDRRESRRGPPPPPSGRRRSLDWEEDFDDDDFDDEGEEDDDDRGRGKGKKEKAGRFEIKIGQPTVTGLEKVSDSAVVVEPIEDGQVMADIPREFRERLRGIEKRLDEIGDRLDELRTTLEGIDGRVQGAEATLDRQSGMFTELEDVRDGFAKVESTVNELSAIYDLVSAQINPFIDMGDYPKKGEDTDGEVDWDMGDDGDDTPVSSVKNPFIDDGDDDGDDDDEPLTIDHKSSISTTSDTRSTPAASDSPHPLDIDNLQKIGPQKWLLKWTDFLLTKVGPEDLPALLGYYKDLGWIDDEVETKVMSYLSGVKGIPKAGAKKLDLDTIVGGDGIAVPDREAWKLTMEDHTKTLEFLDFIRHGSAAPSVSPEGTGRPGAGTPSP